MPRRFDDGCTAIAAERHRQLNELGWSEAHDDQHDRAELAYAALVLAMPPWERDASGIGAVTEMWPELFGPVPAARSFTTREMAGPINDRKREIEKAGALLAAEWDRLNRLEARNG